MEKKERAIKADGKNYNYGGWQNKTRGTPAYYVPEPEFCRQPVSSLVTLAGHGTESQKSDVNSKQKTTTV